jgi:hypothetical protein
MKTPTEVINNLRAPIEPAHGIWELHRRYSDALATMIEQNGKIIELLGPTEKK